MNIEELRDYCLTLPGCTEDMPFGEDVLVFRIEGKIFLMTNLRHPVPKMAIKLRPEDNERLREEYHGITPSYHNNKKHWSDVELEGDYSSTQIKEWIHSSYQLVISKLPKALKNKYL